MTRSALQLLLNIVSALSAAVTIFVAIRSWYPQASPDAKPAILFLCIISGGLIIALIATHSIYARRARYGRVVPALNDIHAELFRLVARRRVPALVQIRMTCQYAVDHLAGIMSATTGRICAVCIKVVVAEEHDTQVFKTRTLCRNRTSIDREGQTRRVDHWVDRNTDFEDLFAEQRRYFFSNWLPWIKNYKNSSFGAYGDPPVFLPFVGGFIRHLRWPLPYRSTIVCAVRPRPSAPSDEETAQNLIGYLCVDSRRANTFSEDDDVELLQGVAESLYPVIRLIKGGQPQP